MAKETDKFAEQDAPPHPHRGWVRGGALVLLKLAVSIGGLYLAFHLAAFPDLTTVGVGWGIWIAGALGLFLAQAALMALRQRLLFKLLGSRIPYSECLKAYLVGLFCGQVLVTFVAGDMVKIWYFARTEPSLLTSSVATVLDRVYGFLGIITLVVPVIGCFLFAGPVAAFDPAAISPAIVVALFAATWACFAVCLRLLAFLSSLAARRAMPKRLERMSLLFGAAFLNLPAVLVLLGLSVVTQGVNILILALIGREMGLALGVQHYLLLTPVPLLLSHLPVSFAGWGVRESAMALSFAGSGTTPDAVVAMSVLFGLGLLVSSAPGLVLLITKRRRKGPAVSTQHID